MKNTKRSFITSLVTLLICSAMFVGSTFAWFTDTVSNTGNRIQAGTLKIDLLMYKDTNTTVDKYASIANSTGDIFKEATTANNSLETLWEPGKTQFAFLAIENKGNLALKYTAYIDVIDEGLVGSLECLLLPLSKEQFDSQLGIYTNWSQIKTAAQALGITPQDVSAGRNEINTGVLDEIAHNPSIENERDYVLLAVHMKEEADNEYQNKEAIIDVTIVATQYTAEEDGFGTNTYDEQAVGEVPTAMPTHEKASSKSIAMTTEENTVTQVGGSSIYGTNNVEIQSESTIATATVSVEAAQDVMIGLLPTEGVDKTKNREMVLNLNVDTTERTTNTITYEIGVTADLTYTDSSGTIQQSTNEVHSLSDYMTATITIPSGLDDVVVTHNGNAMEEMTSATATPTNENGGYYYDSYYGTLTIKSKSFSPFKVSYYLPELTIIWWWPNPKPYTKMDVSSRYYAETNSLQVGQMVPIYSYFTKKDGSKECWIALTSSNPDVIKVTSNITVSIEDCQYNKWYSYIYAVGEGTCTLTFTNETQTGLVKKTYTINVTRETSIDTIDIGSYYTFGEFNFKDASGVSLGTHPIDWVVLDKDTTNNRIYVVSKDILCDMKFDNTSNKTATFDSSSLKTWLNGDFKTGFGDNASKIYGDIELLNHNGIPHTGDIAGTYLGDWNANLAQHYGVTLIKGGIGSGSTSSATSPKWWVIAEDGKATLASMGACQHDEDTTPSVITNSAIFGVRPAMWIALSNNE